MITVEASRNILKTQILINPLDLIGQSKNSNKNPTNSIFSYTIPMNVSDLGLLIGQSLIIVFQIRHRDWYKMGSQVPSGVKVTSTFVTIIYPNF